MSQTSINPKKKQQQMMIIGGVVLVAVVAVIALIALSGQTQASGIDFASLNPTRLDDGGFVIGDPDAPITIVEFADYGCPHCQTYKSEMDRFVREYVVTGKARFEFRTYPTAGGALTEFAGRVAECVDEQQPGSFWKAHELFYQLATSGRYSDRMGAIVADQLGLDYSEILECASDADQVRTDIALGQRVGISGTPALAVRYGDSDPQFITFQGTTYDRSGVPYSVLTQVVEQAQ